MESQYLLVQMMCTHVDLYVIVATILDMQILILINEVPRFLVVCAVQLKRSYI